MFSDLTEEVPFKDTLHLLLNNSIFGVLFTSEMNCTMRFVFILMLKIQLVGENLLYKCEESIEHTISVVQKM